MSTAGWNSLEIAKLGVGLLTPLAVVTLGWFVSRRLKRLEHAQWTNQKVIEKRIAFYDEVAPDLNALLCFFCWVGYYRDISPPQAVQIKRRLDKAMYVYRHLFDDEVFDAYQGFIGLLFQTYAAYNHEAKLRTGVQGPLGSRKEGVNYVWDDRWASLFADPERAPTAADDEVRAAYLRLMNALTKSLGATD